MDRGIWTPLCYLAGCIINGIRYGDTSTTLVEYKQLKILPENIELLQNYPNPFNPVTNIEYVLPKESFVNLTIYNSLGEKIKTLVSGFTNSGDHSIQFEANNLASGVYLYVLRTSGYMQTKKMLLIR